MNEHNTVERKLKTDIHYKNAIRKDLVNSIRQMHEWQERLNQIHNIRKEKKLKRTLERYRGFIEEMRTFLSPLLDELESSIKEEMSFSEEEIREFQQEVQEETKMATEARIAFEKARDTSKAAENEKVEPETLAALKEAYSKAWRAFRLEKHKLEEAREELESEEIDKEIFKRELKRIHVERHFVTEV